MAFVIGIVNGKGGVAKTYSTASIGAGLTLRGRRVLIADADAQCSLGLYLCGGDKGIYENGEYLDDDVLNIYDVITGQCSLTEAAIHKHYVKKRKGEAGYIEVDCDFDMLLGSAHLAELDLGMKNVDELGDLFAGAEGVYDYVIVDFGPGVGAPQLGIMSACRYLMTPIHVGSDIAASVTGYKKIAECVDIIQNVLRKDTDILGPFVTQYDRNDSDSRANMEALMRQKENGFYQLFSTPIRKCNPAFTDYIQRRRPVVTGRDTKTSDDYMALVDEIIDRLEK